MYILFFMMFDSTEVFGQVAFFIYVTWECRVHWLWPPVAT